MTIVATEDTRNSAWAENKAGFGHKMLAKMGWKEGRGLGKNQQGTTNNLRAIRREDSLGIGASTDTHGAEGWSATSANFHGVLAKLKAEHGASSSDADDIERRKKKSKKSKKRRKKSCSSEDEDIVPTKKKRKGLREEEKKGKSGSKLTLPQNRVAAGHSRKMRESKNLVSKSAADMAAIFGVKVEDYRPAGAAVGATGTTVSYSCSDTDPTRKKRSSGSKKKKKKKSRSKNDSLGEEVDNRLAEKKKKKRTKKGEKLKRED